MSDRLTQLLTEVSHAPTAPLDGHDVWRRGRRRRARRMAGPALAVLVLMAGGFLAVRPQDDDEHRVAVGPGIDPVSTLTIPPVGDPVPAVLADGTPVFVAHHADGTVDVFLAASTHVPHGMRQMLGWCPRINAFDDGMFSSAWDAHGRPQSGPAPSDLASFEIVERTAETVTVGSLRRATVRSEGDPRVDGIQCSAGFPGFHADTMVFPDVGPATTLDGAIDAQPSGMVLVHGAAITVTADGSVTACDEQVATEPSRCTAATVEGPQGTVAGTAPFVVVHGDFLARVHGTALSDLIFTAGWAVTGVDPDPPRQCGSFDVNAAWRTDPGALLGGYECLGAAFDAGEYALLRLLFTDGEGNRIPTSYEIDGGKVVVSRQLPSGQEREVCSELVGDDDGSLRPEQCQPA